MTIIKFWSSRNSFRANAATSGLANVVCHDKGEILLKRLRRKHERYSVSVCFSKRDWNDLPGQAKDAKRFLKTKGRALRQLTRGIVTEDGCLSFPVYSRLSKKAVVQQDYFDHELLALCAKHGLGINLAIYG